MSTMKSITRGIATAIFCLLSFNSFAENSKDFGDYTVHFNAFRSDFLTPEIAKAYQITRRNNRMVVNITVLKRMNGDMTQPVKANISGFASNLSGQVKNLTFHEVIDGDAIYYLAQAQVSNRETLKFKIKASPKGETVSTTVNFKQQFYTD